MKKSIILLLLISLSFFISCETESSDKTDPCKDISCSGHGICKVESDKAVCECQTGYQVNNLECIEVDDLCKGVECSNHGVCKVENSKATCDCENGYEADSLTCVKVIDLCENITCSGHGDCKVENDKAICDCENGYHVDSLNCIKDGEVNVCENIDCGNGNCQVIEDVAKCICNDGFNDSDNDNYCSSNYQTITAGGADLEVGYSVIIDKFNNRWVIGEFSDSLDLGCENVLTSTGISNGFIAKFDSDNRCKKLLALKGNEYVVPTDITTDGENLYIIGSFMSNVDLDPSSSTADFTSNGEVDFFVLKLDNSGNYISAKTYGALDDEYISAITIHNEKIYIVGSFQGDVTFNTEVISSNGEDDLFILQLDDNLGYLNLYHNGGVYSDTINDIVVTDDNIYVVGEFSGTINFATTGLDKKTAVSRDGFILKLDLDFNSVWCRQIGGDLDDYISKIVIDSENNIHVGGSFSDIIDFDWTEDGEDLLIADEQYDMFITTITNSGDYVKTLLFEGTSEDDWINDMIIDSNDNICFTGSFEDLIDFNPYSGDDNEDYIIIEGGSDIFITCLTKTGYNFTYTIGEDLNDAGYGIAKDSFNNLVVTGKWQGTANFSPISTSPDEITSNGMGDLFIWNFQIQ